MINKHMKRCSATQITREEQVKMTDSFHFACLRMAMTKNQKILYAGKDVEKLELFCVVGGNVNCVAALENRTTVPPKS